MTEILTLSLREMLATCLRKRISVACIPCALGHEPHFITIGDSINEDSSLDRELCLLTQLSIRHNSGGKVTAVALLLL